jgi:hypothetical protein
VLNPAAVARAAAQPFVGNLRAQAFIANFLVLSLLVVMTNFYLFLTNATCPIPSSCSSDLENGWGNNTRQALGGVNRDQGPFNVKLDARNTLDRETPCNSGNAVGNAAPSTCSTPADFVMPNSSNPLYFVLEILQSSFFAYTLVVGTTMAYKLEKRHRQHTSSFSKEKGLEMQEQLASLDNQLRKKDARIATMEKQKARLQNNT